MALKPCVTGCGAMTLNADCRCQSCRDKGRRPLPDDAAIEHAERMFEMNEAGVASAGRNGTDRNHERYWRGFAQVETA